MDKKYVIIILAIILVVGVIILIAGINQGNFDKKINNNTTNNTTSNNTVNVTHISNNSDESSGSDGQSSSSGSGYREIRDKEYLGDAVVYEDTRTGKHYYQGQEMDYASLADEYNREHGVGPYAKS